MKKLYENPEVEVYKFSAEDTIMNNGREIATVSGIRGDLYDVEEDVFR